MTPYALGAQYAQVNAGQQVTINEHTVCAKATNNNARAMFVPTNTASEWLSFRTNAPINTSLVLDSCAVYFIKIVAGITHSCAITNTGAAYCWGSGTDGKLGNGTTTAKSTPFPVTGLTSGVTDIGAGAYHSCAIHNGAAKCWGQAWEGELGNGLLESYSATPVQVSGLTSDVTAISVGYSHTCAIHSGAAKCWGTGNNGRLGSGASSNSGSPLQVVGLTSGITSISAGYHSSCVVHSGAAKCWGTNSNGELGNNTTTLSTTPVQVTGLTSDVTQVSSGGRTGCAIHAGAAKCWGHNVYGKLGDGTTTQSLVPVQVVGLTSSVNSIQAGKSLNSGHTCAIHNGAAKCWGYSYSGRLGDGAGVDSSVPVQTSGLTSGVTDLSSGDSHSCAIQNSVSKCWSHNGSGRLGDGTTVNKTVPTDVVMP